jgi:hypothetical protein
MPKTETTSIRKRKVTKDVTLSVPPTNTDVLAGVNYAVKITTIKGQQFRRVIRAIANLTNECAIKISPSGMTIIASSSNNVVLCEAFFPRKDFTEYTYIGEKMNPRHPNKGYTFTIPLLDFLQNLSNVNTTDRLRIAILYPAMKLYILCDNMDGTDLTFNELYISDKKWRTIKLKEYPDLVYKVHLKNSEVKKKINNFAKTVIKTTFAVNKENMLVAAQGQYSKGGSLINFVTEDQALAESDIFRETGYEKEDGSMSQSMAKEPIIVQSRYFVEYMTDSKKGGKEEKKSIKSTKKQKKTVNESDSDIEEEEDDEDKFNDEDEINQGLEVNHDMVDEDEDEEEEDAEQPADENGKEEQESDEEEGDDKMANMLDNVFVRKNTAGQIVRTFWKKTLLAIIRNTDFVQWFTMWIGESGPTILQYNVEGIAVLTFWMSSLVEEN